MIKDKQIEILINNVATKNNVDIKDVEEVVDSCYGFIKNTINNLEIKNMTFEEFMNTKKNFNLPKLFKLHASEKKFKHINKII